MMILWGMAPSSHWLFLLVCSPLEESCLLSTLLWCHGKIPNAMWDEEQSWGSQGKIVDGCGSVITGFWWGWGSWAPLELHVSIKTHTQPLRIGGHREFREGQMEHGSATADKGCKLDRVVNWRGRPEAVRQCQTSRRLLALAVRS